MITLGRREEIRHRLVVCGDNQLAYRLSVSLAQEQGNRVTAVLKSRKNNHGPRIAAIDGVRVVESPTLDAEALRAAGIGGRTRWHWWTGPTSTTSTSRCARTRSTRTYGWLSGSPT